MTFFEIIKGLFLGQPYSRQASKKQRIDPALVATRWAHIEELIRIGRPSNFKTAVLEADKLLDYVLKGQGFSGQTMGERMKSIPRKQYDRAFFDAMWSAHKLRNELAHNFEYEVMDFEAKTAVANYKKTLKELGAL